MSKIQPKCWSISRIYCKSALLGSKLELSLLAYTNTNVLTCKLAHSRPNTLSLKYKKHHEIRILFFRLQNFQTFWWNMVFHSFSLGTYCLAHKVNMFVMRELLFCLIGFLCELKIQSPDVRQWAVYCNIIYDVHLRCLPREYLYKMVTSVDILKCLNCLPTKQNSGVLTSDYTRLRHT